jgi:hypothetical protein
MQALGRGLQILGLVLLPVGFLYGIEGGPNALTVELGFLAAGAVAFLVGWRLARGRG